MKSIVLTYPDFQSLPKGIKRLLVASENLFFREAKAAPPERRNQQSSPGTMLNREAGRLGGITAPDAASLS